MESEKIVYTGSPSQIKNLQAFFIGGLLTGAIVAATVLSGNSLFLLALVLPLGYMFWKWLDLRSSKLTITDQRIIVTRGVFTKVTNETELYRVRDTSVQEPFFFRMLGMGNIMVFTTDEDKATHSFEGFAKPHWIKDQIRNYAEECRRRNRWGNDNILLHDHVQG